MSIDDQDQEAQSAVFDETEQGHSEEGRERGEDLSPEQLGDHPVIEVPEDYVAEISFEDLGLPESVLEGVRARGYDKPTPVQAATFPRAMSGLDLVVRSKTGTGKTAAFMLPVLSRLVAEGTGTRAIILAPTRELALQVAQEGTILAAGTGLNVVPIYGGVALGPQTDLLRAGASVVVGTPGRVLDHLRRGNLDLSHALMAVLDEADEMLSMGFLEEVRTILRHLPEERQTLLFSATVDATVAGLIGRFMRDPEEILMSSDASNVSRIKNLIYECSDAYPKARSLLYAIYQENPESAIIFCNTRDDCTFITNYLCRQGMDAEFINSDLPQRERERVMGRIKRGELAFLVATDIAARGIDISDLTHVINYSLPEDPDLYTHRVGRTGRIGKLGTAISLVSGRDLSAELALRNKVKIQFERRTLPDPEEAQKLWTEKHVEKLKKAADTTAYESFVPMVKQMMEILTEKERNRLLATALRVFFSWQKVTVASDAAEDAEDAARGDTGGAGGESQQDRFGSRRPPERGRRPDSRRPEGRRDEGRRPDSRRGEAPRAAAPSRDGRRDSRREGPRDEVRREAPREEARVAAPRDEARRDAPREEARVAAPRDEVRREAPREEARPAVLRDEVPREPARDEAPRVEGVREEGRREGGRDDGRRGGRGRGQDRPARPGEERRVGAGTEIGNRRDDGRRGGQRNDRSQNNRPAEGGARAPAAAESARRPAEGNVAGAPALDILDPLAAFAQVNNLDLSAMIDFDAADLDNLSFDDEGPEEVEGAEEGALDASGQPKRRGNRRRRRGRRGNGSRGAAGGEGSGAPPAAGGEGGGE